MVFSDQLDKSVILLIPMVRKCGEDDTVLAIWVMKDLGAHREKGFVCGIEILNLNRDGFTI